MRIKSLTTQNIAGVIDGTVDLAPGPITAFAGQNGAGKSRLLTCLLFPWHRNIPPSRKPDVEAHVRLLVEFDEEERQQLDYFVAQQYGAGQALTPSTLEYIATRRPVQGIDFRTEPIALGPRDTIANVDFQKLVPSCGVFYLPAERRFSAGGSATIDLSQLADDVALAARHQIGASAIQGSALLDESEFESYARALCVAASLPSEAESNPSSGERSSDEAGTERKGALLKWERFKTAIDRLLAPKELLSLSREFPTSLRVQTSDGSTHLLNELSSGEKQALLIMGRVFRASDDRSIVIIDEPDVHLHPRLSSQLFQLITEDRDGQVVVATHSPAILDTLTPDAIIQMRVGEPITALSTEPERIRLYRDAGFRASELAQSDALLFTEGGFDWQILKELEPAIARASVSSGDGRNGVIFRTKTLSKYDRPVMGIVDRDVEADLIPPAVSHLVLEWPTADIEGLMLSDDRVLQTMLDSGFVKNASKVVDLRAAVDDIGRSFLDNAITEVVQRRVRKRLDISYPSPRGDESLDRLREAVNNRPMLAVTELDRLINDVQAEATSWNLWEVVRGKWAIGKVASELTHFDEGEALLIATANRMKVAPKNMVTALEQVRSLLGVPRMLPS